MASTLGIIADIHADLKSLRLALDILQGQGAEQVLCAGDLVEKGSDGDAVVSLLQQRGIPCVRGNHDVYALSEVWRSQFTHEDLSENTLNYLRNLPLIRSLTIEGKAILIAHGTPTNHSQYVFSYHTERIFRDVLKTAEADIVILGHTHEPMQVAFGDSWILNPGSVCGEQSFGSGTCATLTLPDCHFKVFEVATMNHIQPAYVSF